ncbi:MAG: hypothetical protein JO303_13210 [Caulobacteraceae bacterium]|nr:hypothetical protein [Caulobacteraceae bacterium]
MPILFVTGYADLAALKAVGEASIIQKPFHGDELKRKVGEAIGRSRWSSGNVIRLARAAKRSER